MSGMDAVIQIRARAVKGFSIYADKSRGCAARLPLRASPDPFHSSLRFAKAKLCLSIKAFYAVANLCAAARRRSDCTRAQDGWSEAIPIIGRRGWLMGFARAQPILRATRAAAMAALFAKEESRKQGLGLAVTCTGPGRRADCRFWCG